MSCSCFFEDWFGCVFDHADASVSVVWVFEGFCEFLDESSDSCVHVLADFDVAVASGAFECLAVVEIEFVSGFEQCLLCEVEVPECYLAGLFSSGIHLYRVGQRLVDGFLAREFACFAVS